MNGVNHYVSRKVLPNVKPATNGSKAEEVWPYTDAGLQRSRDIQEDQAYDLLPLQGLRDRSTAAVQQDRTGQVCVCVYIYVCVCVCVCWTAGMKMVIENRHTKRQYVACVIGVNWLNLHV